MLSKQLANNQDLGIEAIQIGNPKSLAENAARGAAKGPTAKGNIAGTHYDPDSANANRASTKRRPAPVNAGGAQAGPGMGRGKPQTKIGGQPTQSKKGGAHAAASGS